MITKFTDFINESAELIAAAKKGKVDTINKILNHKDTDVNFSNRYGNTALGMAIFANNLGAVKAIVEAGADLKKKVDGLTALEFAEKGGNKAIIKYLKSK